MENSKHIIARLKRGATLPQAQAQIDAQNNSLERDDPKAKMLADAAASGLWWRPLRADHVASIRSPPAAMDAGRAALALPADWRGQPGKPGLLIRASGRIKELAVTARLWGRAAGT